MAWYDYIEAWDDVYNTPLDFYLGRLKRFGLKMASPSMDGTNTQLVAVDMGEMIQKANLGTGSGGAINAMYDLGVFIQYVIQANSYGMLPSETWRRQGYRAVSTASATAGMGIIEGGALATAVVPTFVEIAPTPKEFEIVTDYTQRLIVQEAISEGVTIAQNREVVEKDFYKSMNADLNVDGNTLAGDNIESLDRVTASSVTATNLSWTTGDEDLYAIDRSGNTWYDANSLDASGVDRNITEGLWTTLRQNQEQFWQDPVAGKGYLTGHTTFNRFSQLIGASQRFDGAADAVITLNGVKTSPGEKTGFKIATWEGVPIIRDDNVQVDTIDRVYLLDMDYLGIAWGKPPTYLESDPDTSDVFATGHLVRGVHYGIGELFATFPASSGSLRDLQ